MVDQYNILSNYAFKHIEKGNLDEAEFLILGLLSIADNMYGIESPQYATILSNYCYLLYLDNRLKEAIEYGENAKLIFENNRLINSSEYFACLNHLGILYDTIGLPDKALQTYEIALTKVIKKENSPDLIQVLSNIGSQLIKRKKYESAIKYLLHACKIMENQKEADKSNYPLILNTLGLALNGLNKSKKAIKICQKAHRIMINSKRTNSPYYYSILNNLAFSYTLNREYEKALHTYDSLLLCNENLSLNQISTINSNISGVYFFLGSYNESLQYAYASSKNLETFFNDYIGFIPDQYVNQFVACYHLTIDVIYSIVFSLKDISFSDLIKSYNYILNRKSIIYNIDVQRRRFEIMIENEKDQEIINELSILKSERLLKQYSNPDLFDPQSFIYQLDQKCAKIKRILYQKYPLFVNTDEEEETDYYLIREKLPENSVLLDYIWYKHVNKKSKKLEGSRYAVYVINSQKDIELIELGSADEIDNLIKRINSEDTDCDNNPSDLNMLGELLLNPIFHLLKNVSHLIICPDGMLNHLSFEMIRKDGQYLISDYTISYLISSKDIIRNNEESGKPSSPLIIANPDYNLIDNILSPDDYSTAIIHSNNETELYCTLEYSEEEGKVIQEIIGGQLITGDVVSVQRFLEIISPKILHIATHGRFFPISDNNHKPWDSLMRSILIHAGRNAVLIGKPIPNCYGTGVISAWEIMDMNLISTELVVLSACESGLGDILYSEGIFGLHRAFFIAGAKTLIASIWETDDIVTKEMMIHFYTFLKEGRGKADALREAKLKIMQKFPAPYYWGSFRVFGDFGPLIF